MVPFLVSCVLVTSLLGLVSGDGVMQLPDFDSDWVDIKSSSNKADCVRELPHGLGEVPLLVDVQVKAKDGPNKNYIFQATGTQIRDDDQPEGYGDIVYYYDSTHVNVSAPLQNNHHLGKCIYTGTSPYWDGPNFQDSTSAKIRVRAWKASSMPTPDYQETGITIEAGTQKASDSFLTRSHGIGSTPGLVLSRIKNGATYVDSVGASHAVYENQRWQVNGYVVYGFNSATIRVWAASDDKGYLYSGGDGFGIGGSARQGELELYAWSEDTLTPNSTDTKTLSKSVSGSDKQRSLTQVGTEDYVFTRAWIQASSGSSSGYRFIGTGALTYETSKMSEPCGWGGFVYAYTTSHARFWQPNSGYGAMICIARVMGHGTYSQATHDGVAHVKQWELDENECKAVPCKNGGTCANYAWGYKCTCTAGWTGTNCDQDINECSSAPCKNGATCNNGQNKYTCTCAGGWTGTHCDTDINECDSSPCQNGGACTNGQNKYTCTCVAGWTGSSCQTDVDECSSTPCMNGAVCNNGQNKYTCTCAGGWSGTNCDVDIDECTSSPCQNGGACNNGQNNYTCTCTGGWGGTTCETDFDECSSNPCKNGAACTNGQNNYTCTCTTGWSGTNCDADVDECLNNQCLHGATCIDGLNSYTCDCAAGWQGTHCDTGGGIMLLPDFDSDWLDIQSSTDVADCVRYVPHGLGEVPILVDVQVKAIDGPNKDFIFQATGTQIRDDDQPEGYGNIVYYYDSTHVNVTAPKKNNHHLGKCIYTGTDTYWDGPNVQDSTSAKIRVRVWKASSLPKPDFQETNITIEAGTQSASDSFLTRSHGIGSTPGLVLSRIKNDATYVDSVGASHAVYEGQRWQVNGYVVHGFDGTTIRVWAASDDKGYLYSGGDGFGIGGSARQGKLELYAWSEDTLRPNATDTKTLSKSVSGSDKQRSLTMIGSEDVVFTRGWIQASSGSNSGYRFIGTGALTYETSKMSEPCGWGGFVYAYTTSKARFWQPKTGYGALICIARVMGQGTYSQATHDGEAYVKQWELDYNECTAKPCKNGAICANYNWGYTCNCTVGWTGTDCDEDIDECLSGPCKNGATCNNGHNNYTCTCAGGWTGTLCDIDINECASNPCQNGGVCTNGQNEYTCTCTGGYAGINCDTDYDECSSNPCQNGAACTNGQNNYTCTCTGGWSGTNCDVDIDECTSGPCLHGGTCNNGQNEYTCTCTGGWAGTNCDADYDECSSNPCKNGAACTNGQNNYTCTCTGGWSGTNCDEDIDECLSLPCQNGAACVNGQNQYTCTCTGGWQGTNCDTDVDECLSVPCQNGGTCTNGQNEYTCTCVAGYTGTSCQTDFDECASGPCANGANCTDGVNGYTCTCTGGWQGSNCDVDVDECSSSPCVNGTCNNLPNEFSCTCFQDYTGDSCEYKIGSPIDGNWGDWASWQGCSVTCGTGVQRRYRACDNPSPDYGGNSCLGDNYDENACNGGSSCPVAVNGEWGAWSTPTACSATCGQGNTVKYRSCDSPAPSNGGSMCSGDTVLVSTCTIATCSPNTGLGGNYKNTCPAGYFTCEAGRITCIQNVFICDCTNDCDDNSDETTNWAGCDGRCPNSASALQGATWKLAGLVVIAYLLCTFRLA